MSFRTRRWHVPSQNHEPSWGKLRFARSLHQSMSQFGQKNYRSMFVPCHDTMASFMIFVHVLDLQELKNQVSQSFRPSHDAQMFEFHSHFLHGTYKFTQRHTCDFWTNFGALEHVLVFKIWIMHTKVTRSLSEPRTFLREALVCKKLIPKLVPNQLNFFTTAC